MDMNAIFEQALGVVEPWYVEAIDFNLAEKKLDIKLNFRKGSEFVIKFDDGTEEQCKAYDTLEKRWRHLNFFQHECYLLARMPRVRDSKGKLHLISGPWEGLSNGFTLLFEALILQFAKAMPVHNIAELMNISDYKIWAVLDRYVEDARQLEDYSKVSKVGVDETSIAKGHEYISLFVDLEKRKTVFIADGKGHKTVKQFKDDFEQHKGNTKNITDVSCDMSPAFIKGITEILPEAKITFDKFHVLKLINEAVDKVRRAEVKDNPILKKSRYVFLKNEQNLTKAQQLKKEELTGCEFRTITEDDNLESSSKTLIVTPEHNIYSNFNIKLEKASRVLCIENTYALKDQISHFNKCTFDDSEATKIKICLMECKTAEEKIDALPGLLKPYTYLHISELNLKSMIALNIRETFQQIYASPADEFEDLLTKWHDWASKSELEPIKKVAETIKNHWDGIVQWKTSKINNGILEGLNSIVQAAKRKARGFKAKHFKTIAYLITANLDFSKVNPNCQPT